MSECCVYACVCVCVHAWLSTHKGQKKTLGSLELEFTGGHEPINVVTGVQTHVL